MNNKILALVAASTAVLGSAIFNTPAQAQVSSTSEPIGVQVTVPEILYLRTVEDIQLDLELSDFGVAENNGTGQSGTATRESSTLDTTTSPFASLIEGEIDTITIDNVFAVWSNKTGAGTGTVAIVGSEVSLDNTDDDSKMMVSVAPVDPTFTPQGLATAYVGGVDLTLNSPFTAGTYGGGTFQITVTNP